MGLNSPNECIICRPLQERIKSIVINVNSNILFTLKMIEENNQIRNIIPQDPNEIIQFWGCILSINIILLIISVIAWNICIFVWNISHRESFSNQNFDPFPTFEHILCGFLSIILCAMFSSPCGILL